MKTCFCICDKGKHEKIWFCACVFVWKAPPKERKVHGERKKKEKSRSKKVRLILYICICCVEKRGPNWRKPRNEEFSFSLSQFSRKLLREFFPRRENSFLGGGSFLAINFVLITGRGSGSTFLGRISSPIHQRNPLSSLCFVFLFLIRRLTN